VLSRLGADSLEGMRLVDLGCGFGALSVFFGAHGAEVTAVDSNVSRLEVGAAVAERHGLPASFAHGRMEELALPDAMYDVAVENNSLCYVVDREERRCALRETLRVLRPGGLLVARNPNRWNPIDQFTGLPLIQLLPPRTAVRSAAAVGRTRSLCRLTSPPEARRELVRAGFVGVIHHAPAAPGRPGLVNLVARYHHFSALRPAALSPARPGKSRPRTGQVPGART
jgi:SAM-dependent methyltransferase